MNKRFPTRLSLVAAVLGGLVAPLPASAYDLRVIEISAGMPFGVAPKDGDIRYSDMFTNGDPLVGGSYVNGAVGTGSYVVFGSPSAGAETTGPASDWFGANYGIGRLRFQLSDAMEAPTNLDAAGTVTKRETLVLKQPADPILKNSQQWEVETYWDYVLPTAGSTYGVRISDNGHLTPVAGTTFNDTIDLRLVRSAAGAPIINLRRLEWDGSALAITQSFNYQLSGALFSGKSLDDVVAIGFRLHYNAPTAGDPGGLIAGLDLVGAHDEEVGYINYAPVLQIFRGETTTTLVANAGWNVAAVPEPSTWAMWMSGLGLAAWLRRRRG